MKLITALLLIAVPMAAQAPKPGVVKVTVTETQKTKEIRIVTCPKGYMVVYRLSPNYVVIKDEDEMGSYDDRSRYRCVERKAVEWLLKR